MELEQQPAGLQELAELLAEAHESIRQMALKLGGEARFLQARLDVKQLVDQAHMELPDAMLVVYRQLVDEMMRERS